VAPLDDFDIAARQRPCCQACLIDRVNEGGRTAVHDRDFRAVNFDNDVVDVKAAQRRQQMLRCRAKRTLGIAKHGREFSSGHGAHVGANLALDRAVRCNALENDAGVVVSRMKRKGDREAGMDADA